MLRGLRNRSSTRRSQVVSSSDEEEYVATGCNVVKPTPERFKDSSSDIQLSHKYSEPTIQVTESRSTVSLSSSSDGSMFSSESPSVDDDDNNNHQDKLAHESYLNGTIPDLEEILRSFGSKSRRLNTRSGRYNDSTSSKSILDTPALFDTVALDYDDDDRDSNNSSYNSGFSSSSDSSFESIPDTTQIAAFYNSGGESPPSSPEANFVTLSPTSTATDIHQYNIDESVPHKAMSSTRTKSKRQRRRNERRRRRRPSKMNNNAANTNGNVDGNFNDDDNRSRQSFLSRTNSLINTSKSFGKNWTRKKRIDQIVESLSDAETKEKLLSVEPVNQKESESANGSPSLILDQETSTLTPSITISDPEPTLSASNEIVTKVLITKGKVSQVIERFDCDTGELVESGLAVAADRPSKRSHSPVSLPGANKDPLALTEVKLNQELSDNESPQKSCGSSGDHVVNYSISNATDVIENMILLFAKSDVEGIRRLLGESLDSSVSSLSTSSSTLSRNIVFDSSMDEGIDVEEDGSDDKGGSDKQKAKHLRTNKLLSLNGGYKQPSKALHAQYISNDYTLPLSMRGIVTHYSISILLIEPVHKVFEIVTVDVTRTMSLKETLANACIAAADPILAEQKYISLCSDVKVLSNMSSPVSKLIQKPSDLSKNENVKTVSNKMLENEKHKEALMRREMERQLLVAVPLRSNFKECQMIRRILWKNTKLQLWWSTYQMKNVQYATPWSASSTAAITAPVPSTLSSSVRFPQPVAI
jgi:hypothetical protein